MYALGLAGSMGLPGGRSSLGMKLLQEFGARSTFEGVSAQISAAFAF